MTPSSLLHTTGAIPCQLIKNYIQQGLISAASPIPDHNIQPASLDLRLGEKAWAVKATFLPKPEETIETALQRYATSALDLSQPTVFDLNRTYVAELAESFRLPQHVHAYTNNKSTTGRTNVWARTLVDRYPRFDKIPEGYCGKAYLMIIPRSWPIIAQCGQTLTQARLLIGNNALSDYNLQQLQQEVGLVYTPEGYKDRPHLDGGLLLSVDLSQEVVGYRALPCDKPVDLAKVQPSRDYFCRISAQRGELLLERNNFYILSTKEYLRVPPHLAVEMAAYDIHSGEYRSHYAGFFDPGFGYGDQGQLLGTPAVLEVDTHEDVIFTDGQPICKMSFEYLVQLPEKLYGQQLNSHYQHQRGPQLARIFS
ncbi:MAG: 2'-deoxycytidine 5'-triphosphate deaminase [bacterium]|nr:2'-deoxycytidine 5'-triphosphate deaminase [bacterium]